MLYGSGVRKLGGGHDGTKCADLGDVEEDEARSLDERDDCDLRKRQLVEHERDDEPAERGDAHVVSDEHDPTAVPPVGRDAGEEHEEAVGEKPGKADDTGFRRGVRQRKDEQRVGDLRR